MGNLNRIILVGRLTADPESRSTVDGLPITKFRLAVTRPMAGGAEGTDLIDIVAWRKLAEVCGQSLKKGQLVLIEGWIQNRSFEDQTGQRKWVTEVVARNMTMLEKGSAERAPVSIEAEPAGKFLDTEMLGDPGVDPADDLPF